MNSQILVGLTARMRVSILLVCVAICTLAMSITSRAQAQNLFESDASSGHIYEFTPGGARSTFASGLSSPAGLAFDSAGNLFEADSGTYLFCHIYEFTPGGAQSTFASGLSSLRGLAFDSAGNLFAADADGGVGLGDIYKFTPGGARSTFASGLHPEGLAFDSAGNLFATEFDSGQIYKFTPGGAQSTFASGLSSPASLAFQVPEPATWSLLILGAVALLGGCRMRRR